MRRAFLLWHLALVALGVGACEPAFAQPVVEAKDIGSVDLSTSTMWQDLTSASLRCASTGTTCAAGQVFASVVIVNTHASGTLYIQLRHAGSIDTFLNTIAVPPGMALSLPTYGLKTLHLSYRGSTFGVTGYLNVMLLPY